MKTLLLVTGGRGGSDFFQGLLDGHTQILSFPYSLRVDNNFFQMLDMENYSKLAKKFIYLYPVYFNSKNGNKLERYHRLGKNKNQFYQVNKKKFIKNFIILTKSKKLNKFERLKFLHLAYSKTKGENVKKKKILFVHTHIVRWTKKFINNINPKNTEIIHIIRHPLASLASPIKNWLKYKNGKYFFPKDLYFQIDLVFKGIFDLMNLGKVKIIQYEHLHWDHSNTMRDFCKIYKIRYEKCLNNSTKHGLVWWGDSVSGKWLSGINKNFKIKIDTSYFFKKDLYFFQSIHKKIIKKYNYKFIFKTQRVFLKLLPLKCELLVWKNSFKYLFISFKWKHFLSIPYFYFLRILMINFFMLPKKKLPYSIGSKNNY